jgi:hypothetical protein
MPEVVKRTLPRDVATTLTSTRVFAAELSVVLASVDTPMSERPRVIAVRIRFA